MTYICPIITDLFHSSKLILLAIKQRIILQYAFNDWSIPLIQIIQNTNLLHWSLHHLSLNNLIVIQYYSIHNLNNNKEITRFCLKNYHISVYIYFPPRYSKNFSIFPYNFPKLHSTSLFSRKEIPIWEKDRGEIEKNAIFSRIRLSRYRSSCRFW